jgi:hypothetical protein
MKLTTGTYLSSILIIIVLGLVSTSLSAAPQDMPVSFSIAVTPRAGHQSVLSLDDTLRPEIHSWGVSGTVDVGSIFQVWANITDDSSGVLNSTLIIKQDGAPYSRVLMPFNGTHYVVSAGNFAVNHTYSLEIAAYDNAGNSGLSTRMTYNLYKPATQPVDPISTLPVVVVSSLVFLVIVTGIAWFYNLRKTEVIPTDGVEVGIVQ